MQSTFWAKQDSKNLRKFFRIDFYTEKSFMSDKFDIVDYYNTIIRIIRKKNIELKQFLQKVNES